MCCEDEVVVFAACHVALEGRAAAARAGAEGVVDRGRTAGALA